MAKSSEKIVGTAEAWEQGLLGADEEHSQLAEISQAEINESLGLEEISICIPEGLLGDLKAVAELHGIGYQALTKQILQRFVDAEIRLFAREHAPQLVAELKARMEESAQKRDEVA